MEGVGAACTRTLGPHAAAPEGFAYRAPQRLFPHLPSHSTLKRRVQLRVLLIVLLHAARVAMHSPCTLHPTLSCPLHRAFHRYLTDVLPRLPMGALSRMVSSNDTIMGLLPLLERPPWVRTRMPPPGSGGRPVLEKWQGNRCAGSVLP